MAALHPTPRALSMLLAACTFAWGEDTTLSAGRSSNAAVMIDAAERFGAQAVRVREAVARRGRHVRDLQMRVQMSIVDGGPDGGASYDADADEGSLTILEGPTMQNGYLPVRAEADVVGPGGTFHVTIEE